ncbi:Cytochrome P450 E-class group I [Penicillium macrosclerotiorum]|uniref:Cytochrome P450 E-class group I n=1 Tax=Penicillium macrosclerotiorum TaxID=303699 RepID=UPI002549BA07|nr:Cytochrome P450 E-class group I [Penicillium macrosclerotiorum]KAJ5698795.1 Cytochrome P450 E-class group I [Penicillium macrosclerotiorum]
MHLYALLSIVIIAYICWRGIYNRYFHPLREFRGPFWASVSDFFKLWILHTKQAHTLGLEYHQKYGPIVRAAPNLLAVDDPMLLPQIYHRRVDKTDVYTVGVLGEIAPPFQTLKHEEHAMKRKRVAASFTLTNLKSLEGQVDDRIAQWTSVLTSRFAETGQELDFAAWSQWFAYDMICQLSFGEPIGFVSQGRDVENLIENFHQMAPFAAVVGALPWLARPFLENPITRRYFMPKPGDGSGTGKIMAFRDRLLAERLNNPKPRQKGDFLDNILNAKNPDGSSITLDEVKTECFVLMVAASDTTAAFFCGFVRYVLQTPDVYEKLMTEIDDYDRRGLLTHPVPLYDEIKDMPYFSACYKETMRYQPSTPMIIPRYVSEGGMTLHNQFIPAGTEIGANPYVVHRNRRVFGDDAHDFRPERWLEDAERTTLMDKCILTWGYGTRVCLGKNIALLETYKLLIQFFRLFRPSINNRDRPIWRQENLALLVHHDFWIKIASRER